MVGERPQIQAVAGDTAIAARVIGEGPGIGADVDTVAQITRHVVVFQQAVDQPDGRLRGAERLARIDCLVAEESGSGHGHQRRCSAGVQPTAFVARRIYREREVVTIHR